MAGFGVQPQNIVIGVGFKWFARFLDLPTSNFKKKVFSLHPSGHRQSLACLPTFFLFFLQQQAATPSNIVAGEIEMVR